MDSSTEPRHSRRLTDQPWVACLRERAQLLEHIPALERRRSHLLDKSQNRSGAARHILDRAYDLSLEEGLDPVLALELVGCGVAVLELTPPEPSDETHSLTPEFVPPMDEPLSEILLERRLRQTFRRMRAALEQTADLAGAIDHFAREPDVCPFDYSTGQAI